jgi:hypothetical protein
MQIASRDREPKKQLERYLFTWSQEASLLWYPITYYFPHENTKFCIILTTLTKGVGMSSLLPGQSLLGGYLAFCHRRSNLNLKCIVNQPTLRVAPKTMPCFTVAPWYRVNFWFVSLKQKKTSDENLLVWPFPPEEKEAVEKLLKRRFKLVRKEMASDLKFQGFKFQPLAQPPPLW